MNSKMERLELTYDIRDKMFKKNTRLSNLQKDECSFLASILSSKINNNHEMVGIKELVEELHYLKLSDVLFSDFPFSDDEIVEIVNSCISKDVGL